MSMNDPIADMFTRIRNAQMAKKEMVSMPSSKFKLAIVDVLKSEGYIEDFEVVDVKNKPQLTLTLKYFEGQPVISKIKRISRCSLRIYKGVDDLGKVFGGLGTFLVSTSKGLMSDKKARAAKLGGEIIAEIV